MWRSVFKRDDIFNDMYTDVFTLVNTRALVLFEVSSREQPAKRSVHRAALWELCAGDVPMTDRHRFSRRAAELRTFAERVEPLAKMPERARGVDIQSAADLARKAADDLDELVKATPPGCICRRIENDNYSFLDYAEECVHHRQYYFLREKLKADYEKMEKLLKNEVRIRLVAAALSGTALVRDGEIENPERHAIRALAVADAAIAKLTETA